MNWTVGPALVAGPETMLRSWHADKPFDKLRVPSKVEGRRPYKIQKLRALGLTLLFSVLSPPSSATELTDLGQGLAYLRLNDYATVEKAVASNLPENRALVLDLRHAIAGEEEAGRFATALAPRQAAAPLLILVGPGTPSVFAAALAKPPTGVLTVGVKESVPAPAVIVAQSPEADRRAYDALETGVPLAALINGKLEKDRFDESVLVREFANGSRTAQPPAEPDPSAPRKDPADAPPPLTDRVLQRAIQLHRALLAIRQR